MVRAGRGGIHAAYFLSESIVALGWGEVGEIRADDADEEIARRFDKAYPNEKRGARRSGAGQVKRFFREVKVGDPVVTYDNESRTYHLGEILSSAERKLHAPEGGEEWFMYCREVRWTDRIPRDSLSQSTRDSLGLRMTLYRLPAEPSADLMRRVSDATPDDAQDSPPATDDETIDDDFYSQEYIDKSEQFIEDAIAKLGWEDIQELVAGIIRTMGYKTKVSSPGPDRGVDIFASPDGLGFAEPRIFVEVKHRSGSVGAPAIRSFIGGRRDGDRCLYVSTGGFTKEARYEAERAQVPLTLVAISDLRELLVDCYETLDSDIRALVPLKRVYWPIS